MNTWSYILTPSTRGGTDHCPYQKQILTPCGMKVSCHILYSLLGGRYAYSLKGASWVRSAGGNTRDRYSYDISPRWGGCFARGTVGPSSWSLSRWRAGIVQCGSSHCSYRS